MRRFRSHPLAERVRIFDRNVERAIAPARRPVLDAVFYPLSSAADHSLLWVAIGAVRQAAGRAPAGSTLRLAAILATESALTNGVVKLAFRRLRPVLDPQTPLTPLPFGLRRPVTSAFPSGHATSAFTAAGFLARGDPLAPAYHALAAAVAFSRVYVRLHHASDVLAGVAVGILLGRLARRLAPVTASFERPPSGKGQDDAAGNAPPRRPVGANDRPPEEVPWPAVSP